MALPNPTPRVAPSVLESELAALVLPQIVPPVGLNEQITRDTLGQMLELMAELRRRVPVMGLAFRRDAGFWDQIDQLRRSTHSGGRA